MAVPTDGPFPALPQAIPLAASGPPLGRRPAEYYDRARPDLVRAIPASAQHILDVGCAAGWLGETLRRERPSASVIGVERDPEAAELARARLDRVECLDVEHGPLPFRAGEFDCIVYGDVLEHLVDPWGTLRRHLRHLQPHGAVVLSLPNVRQLGLVLKLAVFGRFEYVTEGVLDATHLRFFTLHEIRKWLDAESLRVERLERTLGFWRIQGRAAVPFGWIPGVRDLFTVRYTVTARR
ncbi:MAG: methyltransferase domain-containing protein [Planctomycetes bacterium]|nr:methyltransferase domain-containing protein [Planctomycetota bacterium]MBI3846146.1 methyltransferase domain-containing protein [Planctomycetota bacterium]